MKAAGILAAVGVLRREPPLDQEAALLAIESAGIEPRDAWRLYQFVPIAFCHPLFEGRGVGFPPGYLEASGKARIGRKFVDEPIYIHALANADGALAHGSAVEMLLPVAQHSAEFQAIAALLGPGGSLEDRRLAETLLAPYRRLVSIRPSLASGGFARRQARTESNE